MKVLKHVPRLIVCATANKAAHVIPDEFCDWLADNFHVWEAFVEEADKVLAAGHTRYSHQTIIYYLRHNNAVSEVSTAGWKLNNNATPYLGRLFALVYQDYYDFFTFRETKWKSTGAAVAL